MIIMYRVWFFMIIIYRVRFFAYSVKLKLKERDFFTFLIMGQIVCKQKEISECDSIKRLDDIRGVEKA